MINIDDLTIKQARELAAQFGNPGGSTDHPYTLGPVFVQTLTWVYTGKLIRVTDHELVLTDAARIFDTGRFSEAIRTGKLNEIEPFPNGEVIISRDSSEVSVWSHPLPRETK